MKSYGLDDTIAAVATSAGESGIGIVRLSGKDALSVAGKIFVARKGGRPSDFKSHTLHYGWISSGGKIIDEVILTIMRAPGSYTREDIVEINCHGGIVPLRKVLELALENGCRLAQPGEFTKRAFLNGRIDLAQAEAVLDVIKAKTDAALALGMQQLKGLLSQQLCAIRGELLEILAHLEADIDFPDEGIAALHMQQMLTKLTAAEGRIQGLLRQAPYGRILREGLKAVICGRPNTGKSSLLNALLRQERSIVTSIAGTTRDAIEEIIDIRGVPVRIADTAGIIEPRDLIEKKAIRRSKDYIAAADIVILVFDASKKLKVEDEFIIRRVKNKRVIPVLNKIDLVGHIEKERISALLGEPVLLSAKKRLHIDALEEAIVTCACAGGATVPEPALVAHQRHIEQLKRAQKFIAGALTSLDNKLSGEFIAQDIRDALGHLDVILGTQFSEDVLDRIFAEFCVGK
ncbi:MAG TPA: tRNA uridine-5-carboxymethylaminomethyl(34) synthesis GTPase MnmE [Patescibacteria group bacterium]|nr:tRNA uridine-5-carboxymethylaminomethyl(34) synthesis GTPase MnmE [Patescibacteria group bacterium]